MPSDVPSLTGTGVVLIATYLVHSTLWLLAAWGLIISRGRRSAMLRERVWRWAAVLPFLTTCGQFIASERPHAWTWAIPAVVINASDVEPNASQQHPVEISEHEPRPIAAQPISEVPTAAAADIIEPSPPTIAPLAPQQAGQVDVAAESTSIDETVSEDVAQPHEDAPEIATAPLKDPDTSALQGRRSDVTRQPFPRLSHSWISRDDPALPTHSFSTSLASLPSVSKQKPTNVTKDSRSRWTDSHLPSGRARKRQPLTPSIVPSADSAAPEETVPLGGWVLRVFVAGVGLRIVVGLLRVCWFAVRTVVRVRRLPALSDGPAAELLQELREAHGVLRGVQLVRSDAACEPAALGLWRWTILLPAGIDAHLDRPQLRALLAHELAHLARGDVWWLWIGRTLTAAFGWQPLNRLAVSRWREASEQLCDDWAVAGGVAPMTLAKCLTRVAELRLFAADPSPGLTVIGRPSRLTSRIRRLTSPRTPDRWNTPGRRRLLTAGLLTAAAALSWTGPHIVWGVPSDEPATSDTAEPSFPNSSPSSFPNSGLGTRLPEAPLRDHSPGVGPSSGARETEFLERSSPSRSLGTRPSESLETEEIFLTTEIAALRRDLQHALELLAETESDPEIAALVDCIRARVNALEVRPPETNR